MEFTRCIAEVDLAAVRRNTRRLTGQLSNGAGLLAVVKADAYGHGILPVSRAALAAGAACLGVATAGEGAFLRENGITAPILVFGLCLFDDVALAVRHGLIQTVCDAAAAAAVAAEARRLGVLAEAHFKVDTGMNRLGLPAGAAAGEIMAARALEGLELTGVYSHLAEADGEYTEEQGQLFNGLLGALRDGGLEARAHISSSGSILRFRDCDHDLARAGIALYGLSGSRERGFEAAMELKARVAYVKWIPAGATVGYNRSYTAEAPRMVATVSIGYADGYARALGNRADVLIRGRRAPVIGFVCMDQLMADVTDAGAEAGDEAVLIGRRGGEEVTADELARLTGTISYEVVTGVSPRVPRVYLNE